MKNLLPFILFLATFSSTAQTTFNWSKIADYPAAHWGMNSCSMDGYLYSFGACGAGSNILYRYDIKSDKWDNISVFPGVSVCFTSLAGVNGKLYLAHNNGINIYDVSGNNWETAVISYPAGFDKSGTAVIVAGTDIYYIAGNGTKNLFKLNTLTKNFTKLADLNAGRDLTQATLMNGKIYVFAGRRNGQSLNTVEVYDMATDTWQNLNIVVSNRYFGHATNDGRYIYIFGGETGIGSKKYKSVELIDISTNTVTIMDTAINDMDYDHSGFAFGQIGDTLIAAGGYTNTPSMDLVTKYSEATNFQTVSVQMLTAQQRTSFNIFPNPAANTLNIQLAQPEEIISVEIYSVTGKMVAVKSIKNQQYISFDCTELPSGNYIVKAVGKDATQSKLAQIVK